MRLHRFYIQQKIGDETRVTLSDRGLIHQLKDVFRFVAGARVLLFDNSGFEYLAIVVSIQFNEVKLEILEKHDKTSKAQEVWLFAALIKKDNFEWIIEKATELGVSGIVPITAERSEKKSLNLERGAKILMEASEQSGRVTLPQLEEPQTLSEVIQSVTHRDEGKMNFISIDPEGEPWPAELNRETKKSVGVFVGPEGGWSDRELAMFKDANIPIYSIGSQVLRAETAAVEISALLLLGK